MKIFHSRRFPSIVGSILFLGLVIFLLSNLFLKQFNPKGQLDEFYIGTVEEAQDIAWVDVDGSSQKGQNLTVILENGKAAGEKVSVEHGTIFPLDKDQEVKKGEKLVVTRILEDAQAKTHLISDRYRLSAVLWITLIFFGLAVIFGKKRGFYAILGLIFSLLVLIQFIVPQILNGRNPLVISVAGATLIAFVSFYLSHGFSRKTSIALGSTILTLSIAAGLAMLFVSLGKLSGIGTEEAFYLQLDFASLNAKGLLLGGIIIGALGVLDDVTTTQAATVQEILEANPHLPFSELYRRGITVGKEHIASLVNTLVLAYVGASFPLLLLFTLDKNVPLWVNLNKEFVVEEIIRTLVGSTALLFAVPITTFFAAYFLRKRV